MSVKILHITAKLLLQNSSLQNQNTWRVHVIFVFINYKQITFVLFCILKSWPTRNYQYYTDDVKL